jgi:hypothetical protein
MQLAVSQQQGLAALAANVYISEGRNDPLLSTIQAALSDCPNTSLARVFIDRPYNRTGFTLVSSDAQAVSGAMPLSLSTCHVPNCKPVLQLSSAILALSRAALASLDLSRHTATHPRLGVVDHISVHPLQGPGPGTATGEGPGKGARAEGAVQQRPASRSAALACADDVAQGLSAPPWHLPVFKYGAAHPHGRRLAEVRRQLGGDWGGDLSQNCGASNPVSSQPRAGV